MNEDLIQDYYCYVDKAEIIDEEIHFLFDGISKEWYEEFLNDNFNALENYEKIIPNVIYAKTNYKVLKQFNPEYNLSDFQNIWVHLQLTYKKTPFEAQLFIEDNDENPEPIVMYVKSVAPLNFTNSTATKLLQTKFSLSAIPDANKGQLDTALSHGDFACPDNFVTVYNVGQGNMNAICDSKGIPILYFDLGGGCYQNKSTYRTRLNICFTKFKTIIISHWDADHLATAKRYYNTKDWNKFTGRTWIAPRQTLGPSNFRFAMRVNSISTLLIWPATLNSLKFTDGEVFLCTGPEKNHSGLAILTALNKGIGNIQNVLMPADAAYIYIPFSSSCKLDGIIATHHGAEFDHGNSPVPNANGQFAIAYSYGSRNTYRHPRTPSVQAHSNANWINRKDTVNGGIAFTTNVVSIPSCGGAGCNLSTSQNF